MRRYASTAAILMGATMAAAWLVSRADGGGVSIAPAASWA